MRMNSKFLFFFLCAVDIISAIEFDRTGDYLATGDRGGRVVLFERTDNRDVSDCIPFALAKFPHVQVISCSICL